MTVELRSDVTNAELLEAWAGDRKVGVARIAMTAVASRAAADLYDIATRADALDLVGALVARAQAGGVAELQLHSSSLLLRFEARSAGFHGGLRQPLDLSLASAHLLGTGHGTRPGGESEDQPPTLVGALRDWGIVVDAGRPPGPLRQMIQRSVGGVGKMLEVRVSWAAGRSFKISVPDRADLMPEAVGCCADTAGAVLRRFANHASAVRAISFDRTERGLVTGRLGGLANSSTGEIHLNPGLVAADALVEMENRRSARRPQLAVEGFASPPYLALDRTTAHELWHQIETAALVHDHQLGFEMRRRLGECLGVATLEHAIKGREKRSPPAWQDAYRRLSEEVSAYATTNPIEATVEIFTHWWCPQGPVAAVVACFGQLVDELMPPPGPG